MGVAAGDYTVPAPSIFSTSSTNTGIDFRGTDSIDFYVAGTGYFAVNYNGLQMKSDGTLAISPGSPVTQAPDTFLGRNAAATWRFGNVDADTNAAIVAQTILVQSVSAGGTSDQAGKDFTIGGSKGKGTGIGGKIILATSPVGSTGTSVNALVNAWAVDGNQTLHPLGSLATNMTNGFINIPGAAGAASGTPGNTTGFPMYYDSTNNKIYVYNGSWRSTAALT
jgi:hypothetical protein